MRNWFKQRKATGGKSDAAQRIASSILRQQQRIADCLNAGAAGWSRCRLVTLALLSGAGFAAYCIYLVVAGLNGL